MGGWILSILGLANLPVKVTSSFGKPGRGVGWGEPDMCAPPPETALLRSREGRAGGSSGSVEAEQQEALGIPLATKDSSAGGGEEEEFWGGLEHELSMPGGEGRAFQGAVMLRTKVCERMAYLEDRLL